MDMKYPAHSRSLLHHIYYYIIFIFNLVQPTSSSLKALFIFYSFHGYSPIALTLVDFCVFWNLSVYFLKTLTEHLLLLINYLVMDLFASVSVFPSANLKGLSCIGCWASPQWFKKNLRYAVIIFAVNVTQKIFLIFLGKVVAPMTVTCHTIG